MFSSPIQRSISDQQDHINKQLQDGIENLKRLRKAELKQVAILLDLSSRCSKPKDDLLQEVITQLDFRKRKLLKALKVKEFCPKGFRHDLHMFYACLQAISEQCMFTGKDPRSCEVNLNGEFSSQACCSDPLIQVAETLGRAILKDLSSTRKNAFIKFNVSPGLFTRIQENSSKSQASSTLETEVLVRCFQADSETMSLVSGHAWPAQCKIFVNGYRVHMIQHHTKYFGEYESRSGFDVPARISNLLRKGENILSIVGNSAHATHYLQIEVGYAQNIFKLAEAVVQSCNCGRNESLKKYLTHTSSASDNKVHLSTVCPLSNKMMSIPVKGPNCRHLESFDLISFLKMNQLCSHFRWQCPICSISLRALNFEVDSFLAVSISLLKKSGLNMVTNICVHSITGEWSVCSEPSSSSIEYSESHPSYSRNECRHHQSSNPAPVQNENNHAPIPNGSQLEVSNNPVKNETSSINDSNRASDEKLPLETLTDEPSLMLTCFLFDELETILHS